jgi:hypothetical protein
MALQGRSRSAAARPAAFAPHGVTLAVYGAAIFLSAGLLFAVQPLFAKIVLPRLGGAPSVWSVAMVFFQATLLAGYLYAHLLTRLLPGRQSVIVHVLVMLAATVALPLGIAMGWGRPPTQGESVWLLGLFAASIGLPFFALSANAPLLQAWFARTGHPSARDPYFLYAASNAGSFLALLSYPLLVEPLTRLGQQTYSWSALFYGLIALIAVCGVLLVLSRDRNPSTIPVAEGRLAGATWQDAAIWMALAAVPVGLMIAVTAHITTDIAAAPLLWVIPLALYLLTFVFVFPTRPIVPHEPFVRTQPFFIALLLATFVISITHNILLIVAIHIMAFFVTAMVCHGELARRRPPARDLTAFYLWIAAGGVLGGIFAGLVAPQIFNWVAEYPLLIVAAALCRPGWVLRAGADARWFWIGALALAVLVLGPHFAFGYRFDYSGYGGVLIVLLAIAVLLADNTPRHAAVIALAILFIWTYDSENDSRTSVRSFFGVHKIVDASDGEYRLLMHGTTIHGAQQIQADGKPIVGRPDPLTYYSVNSGIGQTIAAVRERKGAPVRIAAIGLGTGTIACLAQPDDVVTFYEIDRTVVRISRDAGHFTYLANCAPDAEIVLGDARLTLADSPDGRYDVIVVDAFSSDAIPIHLLTREAMEVYLRKIAPGGLAALHISNRHLELASVVAGVADAHGAVTRVNYGLDGPDGHLPYRYSTTVATVAREEADFGALAKSESWAVEKADPKQWVWTDDYSNIVGALIRHMR